MILSDLLVALSANTGVNIVLVDDADNQLITFNASGYASIESDLGTRVVKNIKVNSAKEIAISIKDAT